MNNYMRLLPAFLTACGMLLGLPQGAQATTVHQVQAGIHVSVVEGAGNPGIDTSDINRAFWFGTAAVRNDDDAVTWPIEDNPCDTRFQGTGIIMHLSATDGTISNASEVDQLLNNGKAFYIVVDQIFRCKGMGGFFNHCSEGVQKPFWVTNEMADASGMPGVTFAHTFGEAMGLKHASHPNRLMYANRLTPESVAITASECTNFRTVTSVSCPGPVGICEWFEGGASASTFLTPLPSVQLAAVPLDQPPPSRERQATIEAAPVSSAHGAVTAIETLARAAIGDRLPMGAVGKYDEADVGVLRASMGKGGFRTDTALVLIGMLSDGSPEDIHVLATHLSGDSAHESGAAGAGLGYLVARLGVREGIAVLSRAARSPTPHVAQAGKLGLSVSGQEEAERVLAGFRGAGGRSGDADVSSMLAFNRRVRAAGWLETYSDKGGR